MKGRRATNSARRAELWGYRVRTPHYRVSTQIPLCGESSRRVMLGETDSERQEEPMTALTRIAFVVLLAGCASGGRPTPHAIFRHLERPTRELRS